MTYLTYWAVTPCNGESSGKIEKEMDIGFPKIRCTFLWVTIFQYFGVYGRALIFIETNICRDVRWSSRVWSLFGSPVDFQRGTL